MDKSEVKAWVESNIDALKKMYGLSQWVILVQFGPCPAGGAGECKKHVEYEQSRIWLDPGDIEDTEDLERIFKHELCHIVHSPFDIFWCSVMSYVPEGAAYDAMQNLWRHSQELTVRNLERMHAGHKAAFEAESDV